MKLIIFLFLVSPIISCADDVKTIESDLQQTRAQYDLLKPNNPNFLIEIGKFEQKVRKNIYLIEQSKVDKKSKFELKQSNYELMDYIDNKNIEFLLALKPKDKWFSPKEIGNEAAMYAFLIMQHADAKIQQKYYSELKNSMQSGDLPKEEFALFEDRVLVSKGQKQIYGSQFHCEAGKLIPFPIEDLKNIDMLRKSMDLKQSFKEYEAQLSKFSKCD